MADQMVRPIISLATGPEAALEVALPGPGAGRVESTLHCMDI
jgi:hypothetical protein